VTAAPAVRAQDDAPIPAQLLPDERSTIEIFRRVSGAVVFITNKELVRRDWFSMDVTEVPRGTGSGFIWDKEGHVVTNYHVVQGSQYTRYSATLADGSVHDAVLVGAEATKDIAVLRLESPPPDVQPVAVGTSKNLLVGQKVLAIGNPFGLDQTLTTGIISALGREIRSVAGTTIHDVIQTDASINPGNSGGPLLNSSGHVIGINTAIYSTSGSSAGIGFAVPMDTVNRVVPELIEFGHVKRAGLGIRRVADNHARRWGIQGVIIQEVLHSGPADKAGLRPARVDRNGRVRIGDVIIGIDEKPVTNFDDLYLALDDRKPGETVNVVIRRGDQTLEVRLELQELSE
jgi:S1-C subfamily serine protease